MGRALALSDAGALQGVNGSSQISSSNVDDLATLPDSQPRGNISPVMDPLLYRRSFPHAWGQYLRERYRTAYAVQRAFPDIDMKTARDWIGGKRDPSGNFVIRAVAMDETALEILGAIA